MTFTDLRPDRILLVSVLVDDEWCDGDLEAYRREPNGSFSGWVRFTQGGSTEHRRWIGEAELATSDRDSKKKRLGVISRIDAKLEKERAD